MLNLARSTNIMPFCITIHPLAHQVHSSDSHKVRRQVSSKESPPLKSPPHIQQCAHTIHGASAPACTHGAAMSDVTMPVTGWHAPDPDSGRKSATWRPEICAARQSSLVLRPGGMPERTRNNATTPLSRTTSQSDTNK